jgi:TRAP-type C4-dicarboxylate transport system permease small subunit
MSSSRVAAIVLIVLGVLALAYGGFTYTSETHEATLGPLSVSVDEKERVNIPVWAGAGAIVIGGLLFFFATNRQ